VVQALGGVVKFWITINEPNVYIYHSYVIGMWTPQKKSILSGFKVMRQLALAHTKAYRCIHAEYAKHDWQEPMVSISQAIAYYESYRKESFMDRLSIRIRDFFNHYLFYNLIWHSPFNIPSLIFGSFGTKRCLDFIGLNYYFRQIISSAPKLTSPGDLMGRVRCDDDRYRMSAKNDLEWEIYPEGLYHVLKKVQEYHLPILITENGMSGSDEVRVQFIHDHIESVYRAIQDGVNVIGYLHWSLLDNFEWSLGYGPKFGLIEVDLKNFKRRPKNSSKYYAEICKQNALIPNHEKDA